MTVHEGPFRRLRAALRVLIGRKTGTDRAPTGVAPGAEFPSWWSETTARVMADARRDAVKECRRLADHFGLWQAPSRLAFDAERGSLRFELGDGTEVVLAVDDAETALLMAAAMHLGGLRLCIDADVGGLLHVYGCWENWRGSLHGLPARTDTW